MGLGKNVIETFQKVNLQAIGGDPNSATFLGWIQDMATLTLELFLSKFIEKQGR